MDAHAQKQQAKAALRQDVLTRLKAKPGAQRAADSAALRALLVPLFAEQGRRLARPLRIALYAPLPHEVDLLPLLREHPQHAYGFPRCLPGRQLAFHVVREPARELVPGTLGILAPLPQLPLMAPEDIDLMLVPGVAFSEDGARLGYGGGYYDRFIPRCTNARLIALAFKEQLVPAGSIPCEPHDVRVGQIIVDQPRAQRAERSL